MIDPDTRYNRRREPPGRFERILWPIVGWGGLAWTAWNIWSQFAG